MTTTPIDRGRASRLHKIALIREAMRYTRALPMVREDPAIAAALAGLDYTADIDVIARPDGTVTLTIDIAVTTTGATP